MREYQLICPHCHHHVARGVHHCRECHAEIEYGTPSTLILLVLVAAVCAGIEVTALCGAPWVGVAAAVALATILCVWFARMFRDRVVFNRVHRIY